MPGHVVQIVLLIMNQALGGSERSVAVVTLGQVQAQVTDVEALGGLNGESPVDGDTTLRHLPSFTEAQRRRSIAPGKIR